MTLAVRMEALGGPEVLKLADIAVPPPGPGEARIRHTAIGVNYVDIYHRTGLYPMPPLPAAPGVEGAGIVEAVGPDVTAVRPGDRVAYAGLPVGAYAQARLVPAWRLVRLPDTVPDRIAAGAMLRGITVHMLLTRVHKIRAGDTLLVHAAAGGVGLLLTQWAKSLGATVIGIVGSVEKAELARTHGLDHAVLHRETDFVAEVRRLTEGRGVDVAVDGIGGATLLRTLDCVRPFGTVASIGQVEGSIPDLSVAELGPRRSLSLARPSVFAYANDREAYAVAAAEVLARLGAGLKAEIGAVYPLAEAAEAQRALEAGRTVGAVVLAP